MPKISIDLNKCIGCGTCYAMHPEIFKDRGDGKSSVIDHDYASHGVTKEELENLCPAGAIKVEE